VTERTFLVEVLREGGSARVFSSNADLDGMQLAVPMDQSWPPNAERVSANLLMVLGSNPGEVSCQLTPVAS
jgi:hypothetical protein